MRGVPCAGESALAIEGAVIVLCPDKFMLSPVVSQRGFFDVFDLFFKCFIGKNGCVCVLSFFRTSRICTLLCRFDLFGFYVGLVTFTDPLGCNCTVVFCPGIGGFPPFVPESRDDGIRLFNRL